MGIPANSRSGKSVIGLVLLVLGVVLLVLGVSAMDSFSSDVSRFFTGSPTDKAVWMTIGGVVAVMFGLFGLTRRTA